MEKNGFDISAFANGGIAERIEIATQQVYENIYDPNTNGEKARKLTIELTFKPNKNDRAMIEVTGIVKATLQPHSAISSAMLIGMDNNGNVVGEEWDRNAMKGQEKIEIKENDDVIDLQKRKVD